MGKKTLLYILLAAALVTVFFVTRALVDFSLKFLEEKLPKNFSLSELEQKIFAPGGLRGPEEDQQSFLTRAGIIAWTNRQRQNNGIASLKENTRLNNAATTKTKDMFARQYLEHVSPTGDDAGDLAHQVGYQYVVIGENLALGNFKDDAELVQAWMDSPGHQANILNTSYQEIGAAAVRGTFEGKSTWLAVQIFGKPLSSCPQLDESLKARISVNQQQIDVWERELQGLRAELDRKRSKRDPEYNQRVEEYNTLVRQYNQLITETKSLVETYNAQVRAFNACASG